MKKTAIVLLLCLLLWLLTSCKIDGTLQGLFGYYKTTKSEKIVDLRYFSANTDCIKPSFDTLTVVVANGKEIKDCLKNYEHSIVYFWSLKCRRPICYPLNLLQKACLEKEIELFVVASYYDSETMSKNYDLVRPIIGINTGYYSDLKVNFWHLEHFVNLAA